MFIFFIPLWKFMSRSQHPIELSESKLVRKKWNSSSSNLLEILTANYNNVLYDSSAPLANSDFIGYVQTTQINIAKLLFWTIFPVFKVVIYTTGQPHPDSYNISIEILRDLNSTVYLRMCFLYFLYLCAMCAFLSFYSMLTFLCSDLLTSAYRSLLKCGHIFKVGKVSFL